MKLRYLEYINKNGNSEEPELQYWREDLHSWDIVRTVVCNREDYNEVMQDEHAC